jgi:bifunctional DNA-binding transcriptional regulator/antitoxin component of YhaV-PrlF toxin-antitoxin module
MYMQQYVTITSQGQITIPIAFRKKFGLDKATKAIIKADGDSVVIESIPDIRSLQGIFKTHKRLSVAEEKKLIAQGWANGDI